jgi:hypothetical protein
MAHRTLAMFAIFGNCLLTGNTVFDMEHGTRIITVGCSDPGDHAQQQEWAARIPNSFRLRAIGIA